MGSFSKAAYGQVYILSGIVQSFSRNIETKYPNIGYLMFIITAKYRLSINERSKNRRDYPYATTRTRTYTEERGFGLSGFLGFGFRGRGGGERGRAERRAH
jgi:hypothetical protein